MMDSERDFDLLGESVPQVRVSARTLALLGFFQLFIYSDSLLSKTKRKKYIYSWLGEANVNNAVNKVPHFIGATTPRPFAPFFARSTWRNDKTND